MTGSEPSLVLASGSPRRRELLERLGFRLVIRPAAVVETQLPGESPPATALRIAAAKACSVLRSENEVVIAADTVVVLGTKVLGKPANRTEAQDMLRELAGRPHLVITATSVRWADRETNDLSIAQVRFRPLGHQILDWYLETGEWMDKAGAYAVQGKGAILVERVEGNVQGVVGLPLAALPEIFARVGLQLRHFGDRLTLRAC